MTLSIAAQQFGPAEVDEEGQRTYKLLTVLESSTGLDGPANVQQCELLPQAGATWNILDDSDEWAWCRANMSIKSREVTDEKVKFWDVEQTFSTKAQPKDKQRCMDVKVQDPLLEPPKVSGSFVKEKEPATNDRFGFPIVNSAHELLRGPTVEFDKNKPTIKIEQNVATALQAYILPGLMADCVNAYPIWGFPPRTVKLSQPTWDRMFYGTCLVYYKRTLEFEVDKTTWDRTTVDEGNKVLNGRWDQATGNWVLVDIPGQGAPQYYNPQHFIQFTDRNGQAARVILDGRGRPSGVPIVGRRPMIPVGNTAMYRPIAGNFQVFGWVFPSAYREVHTYYGNLLGGTLKLTLPQHNLSNGSQILLTNTQSSGVLLPLDSPIQGYLTVNRIDENTVEIAESFILQEEALLLSGGQWAPVFQISSITDTTPIVIDTGLQQHRLETGDTVVVEGTSNGVVNTVEWYVTVIDSHTFSLDGSVIQYGTPGNTGTGTLEIEAASGPGQINISKYDEADFLLLGIPTSF
jgi:hypothetical protein